MEALSQPCLGSTSAGLRSEWNGGRQHLPLTPTHLPVSLTRSYDYDPDFIRKGEQQPSSSSDPMQDDPAAAGGGGDGAGDAGSGAGNTRLSALLQGSAGECHDEGGGDLKISRKRHRSLSERAAVGNERGVDRGPQRAVACPRGEASKRKSGSEVPAGRGVKGWIKAAEMVTAKVRMRFWATSPLRHAYSVVFLLLTMHGAARCMTLLDILPCENLPHPSSDVYIMWGPPSSHP